jgi:uncharacterized protein
MLYLDTSILVSALTNEADTAAVQAWLAGQVARDLTISDWVVTEFSSAMSIKLRSGQLGPDHRAAALASFTRLAADTLRILPVERASFRTAARFADQPTLNLRAGDALHLAICAEWGATLCTLDRRLGEAAPVVGVGSVLL